MLHAFCVQYLYNGGFRFHRSGGWGGVGEWIMRGPGWIRDQGRGERVITNCSASRNWDILIVYFQFIMLLSSYSDIYLFYLCMADEAIRAWKVMPHSKQFSHLKWISGKGICERNTFIMKWIRFKRIVYVERVVWFWKKNTFYIYSHLLLHRKERYPEKV